MKINKIISHIDLGNDPGYKARDLRVVAKADKWDHKKLKIFSTAKETITETIKRAGENPCQLHRWLDYA